MIDMRIKMKIELYKQSKSIRILFDKYSITFAIGYYSKKFLDYYEIKTLNKKVIQSKFFWLCLMGDNVWRIKK